MFLTVFFSALAAASVARAESIQLQVSTLEGGRQIDFGPVQSLRPDGSAPATVVSREVVVSIATDLNKRYLVSQMVLSAPVGSQGAVCPVESVRYTVRLKTGNGEVRTTSQAVLRQGQEDIFISDAAGQPAELVILYELLVPAGQKAGNYNSSITYKVSTL